jgi:DNA (cytosine-5)-methyltransferase 1
MRYAEFCAGVGGFRLGIQSSDLKGEAVFVNEIDDSCEKTYEKNFHQKFDAKDIFEIVPETLPAFDMLCAGFPCQPFSVAGKELGFHDPRGTVFFKILEIIKAKQPNIVFLENVPNLIRHDGGKTYKTILKSLDDAGYMLSSAVLDCSYFGVPQSRSRVYIIGLQKEKYGDLRVEFSSKKTERTPLRPFLIPGDYSIPISSRWQEYIDLYTGQKSADELSFDVPRTRCALERIASNCDIQDCVFQVRSSGVRALSLDEPFPTFTVLNSGGGAHIPILSKERRHLSIQEIKRIMGFPEWYDFSSVSRTDAAKELANAVSPPVITSICNDIARAIHTN